jgi:DinB family.
MRVRVGLENGIEGRSLAWGLDYPGCFSYGQNGPEALINFPMALIRHKNWVESRIENSWLSDLKDFDVGLEEVFECYNIDKDYNSVDSDIEINAWFRDDWRPLTKLEVQRGLMLLAWSRGELLELIQSIPAEIIDLEHPGELWPIRGIVRHIANGEHWYLSRFSRQDTPRAELPEDMLERLTAVRRNVNCVLEKMPGDRTVVGVMGEFWSPRKFLRRLLWHEKDHILHIQKLAFPTAGEQKESS